MRPLRPGQKAFIPLFVVFLGLLAAWISRRDGGISPPTSPADAPDNVANREPDVPAHAGQRADFDFYLLALTAHPAFCADGHRREPECRVDRSIPISIHGLWPEKLEPGKYPRDCQGPLLDLRKELEHQMLPLMPGMTDGLHIHEWRKHGTCTGLDDDQYFGAMLVMARKVDAALAKELTTLAGRATTANELRDFADEHEAGLGATLTFHCRTLRNAPQEHSREPHLIEIRQCIDDSAYQGAPGKPIDCATVNRRDQGCGRQFRIAVAGEG